MANHETVSRHHTSHEESPVTEARVLLRAHHRDPEAMYTLFESRDTFAELGRLGNLRVENVALTVVESRVRRPSPKFLPEKDVPEIAASQVLPERLGIEVRGKPRGRMRSDVGDDLDFVT